MLEILGSYNFARIMSEKKEECGQGPGPVSKLFLTTPSLGVTKNNLDTPGCSNLHSGSYRASAFIGRPRFLSS